MSIMSWISGQITNLETYLAMAERAVLADLAPAIANLETEFVSAEKKFMADEYEAFKSIVAQTFATVKAANPGVTVFALAKLVAEAALPALESGGLRIAETALLSFVTTLL